MDSESDDDSESESEADDDTVSLIEEVEDAAALVDGDVVTDEDTDKVVLLEMEPEAVTDFNGARDVDEERVTD